MFGSRSYFSGANSWITCPADPCLFPLASEPRLHPEWKDADEKKATITTDIQKKQKISNIIFPLNNSYKCIKRKIGKNRLIGRESCWVP